MEPQASTASANTGRITSEVRPRPESGPAETASRPGPDGRGRVSSADRLRLNRAARKARGRLGLGTGGRNEGKEKRLNFVIISLMIIWALFCDLVSIIPIINIISTFLAWGSFALWFWLLGFGLVNTRRLAAPIVSIIIEIIPALSLIPSITLSIIITIVVIKLESKTGLKLPGSSQTSK